jgi:hypothetical protein
MSPPTCCPECSYYKEVTTSCRPSAAREDEQRQRLTTSDVEAWQNDGKNDEENKNMGIVNNQRGREYEGREKG